MKKWFFLLFVIGLVGVTIYNQPKTKDAIARQVEQKPEMGYQAPSFSLQGLDNKTYQLSGPREKPLVINFWASWCGPCQAEAPALREIYLKHQKDVDFYAINVTSNDDLESAKKFADQYQLPFPIPLDVEGKVANLYRVNAFPTTYLIDRQGIIRRQMIGMVEPETFEKLVEALISLK
jgi:cytochrome c biogenesis protein CcmG/thiol:disulfide interchange protein DsbE